MTSDREFLARQIEEVANDVRNGAPIIEISRRLHDLCLSAAVRTLDERNLNLPLEEVDRRH